jgi:hypothetical protein
MKLPRSSRLVAAMVALFSILFMQFAVASYVCPGQGRVQMQAAVMEAAGDSMNGCMGMDMEQPSLCHAYDQKASQSLDKPVAPPVPPFVPATLVALLVPSEPAFPSSASYVRSPLLARPTAPPLAIRNCCFRI